VFQQIDDVTAVLFLAHERKNLVILRLAVGLDDVTLRVFAHELKGGVEGVEVPARQSVDTSPFHFGLAEVAVLFQTVGVLCAAHNETALLSESLASVAKIGIVEDQHVRPVLVLLPAVHFFQEAISDIFIVLG
jgi:hypothetical protein